MWAPAVVIVLIYWQIYAAVTSVARGARGLLQHLGVRGHVHRSA